MNKNKQVVQRIPAYLLTGVLVFLVINFISIQFADTPHEIRNEVMAFYFGPIVTLGKIIYWFVGGCKGIGRDIYSLLSGPSAIQLGNYAPSMFYKFLTGIIGIFWTTFLIFLIDSVKLENIFHSRYIKIPVIFGTIIISLIIIYWLNGDGNSYYSSLCLP